LSQSEGIKTIAVICHDPDAIKDLEHIYEYICTQSEFPESAWAFIEKLRLKCQKLETSPIRGNGNYNCR